MWFIRSNQLTGTSVIDHELIAEALFMQMSMPSNLLHSPCDRASNCIAVANVADNRERVAADFLDYIRRGDTVPGSFG
jgi:hypothetical protein